MLELTYLTKQVTSTDPKTLFLFYVKYHRPYKEHMFK